jgi:hypothetical protein
LITSKTTGINYAFNPKENAKTSLLSLKDLPLSKANISICDSQFLKVYKYLVVKLLCFLFSCMNLFCIMLQAWIFGQECKYTVTNIELLNHFKIKYVNVSAFFFFFFFSSSQIPLLLKLELACLCIILCQRINLFV